jgi:NAD(P)-dependent dehydrogenase (short-subunit alcohol dehydrogenase family)
VASAGRNAGTQPRETDKNVCPTTGRPNDDRAGAEGRGNRIAGSGDPVAIVTGAGRGIGRATAVELAGRGYRVVLVGRNRAPLDDVSAAVGGHMRRAAVAVGDVSDASAVTRIVDEATRAFGRVDVVVNNAGLAPVRTIEQMTIAEWRAVIDTNLSAAFYLTKAAWPTFVRQGGGVVVNLSSLSCRDPFPGFAAYGAAKAGLNLLGLALACEGSPHGIRVHTIAPGAVETEMFRGLMTPEQWPTEKTLAPALLA